MTAACGASVSLVAWGEPDITITCYLPTGHDGHHRGDGGYLWDDDPDSVLQERATDAFPTATPSEIGDVR